MTQEILPYSQKAYVLEDMEKHTNVEYNVSVYELARATITKYHRLDSLNRRRFHSPGGRKSKIKVPAGFVSDETSLLGLQMAPPSFVFTWSFLWA